MSISLKGLSMRARNMAVLLTIVSSWPGREPGICYTLDNYFLVDVWVVSGRIKMETSQFSKAQRYFSSGASFYFLLGP